jgi:hypothetical protein
LYKSWWNYKWGMMLLGVQEGIFGDFFKKLADAKLPEDLIKELKALLEKGELENKEKILEAVKRGVEAVYKHQKR